MKNEVLSIIFAFLILTITLSGCLEDITADEIKIKFLQTIEDVTSYKYSTNTTIHQTIIIESQTNITEITTIQKGEVDKSNKQLKQEYDIQSSDESEQQYSITYLIDNIEYIGTGSKDNITWSHQFLYSNMTWIVYSLLEQMALYLSDSDFDIGDIKITRLPDEVVEDVDCYVLLLTSVSNQSAESSTLNRSGYRYQKIEIKYWIAKEDYLLIRTKSGTTYDSTGFYSWKGNRSIMISETCVEFYDYNIPVTIELPPDAPIFWKGYTKEWDGPVFNLTLNTTNNFGEDLELYYSVYESRDEKTNQTWYTSDWIGVVPAFTMKNHSFNVKAGSLGYELNIYYYDINRTLHTNKSNLGFDFTNELEEDMIYYIEITTEGDIIVTENYSSITQIEPLTVIATPNVKTGFVPLVVSFEGMCTDSDCEDPSFLWDFGDGNTSTEQNPTYIYSYEGTYTVRLSITDKNGRFGKDIISIETSYAEPEIIYHNYHIASFNTLSGGFTTDVRIFVLVKNVCPYNIEFVSLNATLYDSEGNILIHRRGGSGPVPDFIIKPQDTGLLVYYFSSSATYDDYDLSELDHYEIDIFGFSITDKSPYEYFVVKDSRIEEDYEYIIINATLHNTGNENVTYATIYCMLYDSDGNMIYVKQKSIDNQYLKSGIEYPFEMKITKSRVSFNTEDISNYDFRIANEI
jgi:hypothetical protein